MVCSNSVTKLVARLGLCDKMCKSYLCVAKSIIIHVGTRKRFSDKFRIELRELVS